MFGQYRKFFMVSVAVTMLSFGLMTSNVSAESVKEYQNLETSLTNRNNKQFSFQELIEIANPYIVENFYSYSIVREDELKGKIGEINFKTIQLCLEIANKEKLEKLNRDAVSDEHISILRAAGAEVSSEWSGKRIRTYDRETAIKVRKLASGFSGDAGAEGLKYALISANLAFVPGLGEAATVAGTLVSIVTWADSTTWSKVFDLVASKIDDGEYNLTIDINGWNMDVRVY